MKNIYYGCFINRKTGNGYQLKYTTYVNGRSVAADTIQGIKELIRYYKKEKTS